MGNQAFSELNLNQQNQHNVQTLNIDGLNNTLHQQVQPSFLYAQQSHQQPQHSNMNLQSQINITNSLSNFNGQSHNNLSHNAASNINPNGKEANENDMIGGLLYFLDSNEKTESKLPLSGTSSFPQHQQGPGASSVLLNMNRGAPSSTVNNTKKDSIDFEEDDLFADMENERKRMMNHSSFENSN